MSHPPTPAPGIRVLDPLDVEVPRPLVLLRLGYRRPEQVPARTAALLDEVITHGRTLLRPRAVHGTFDVAIEPPDRTVIGVTLRSDSRSLRERLQGCPRAVLFAATIGAETEAWIHRLSEAGEMTRSLLADAYGSAAAIIAGTAMEAVAARSLAEEGLRPTRRYAPGYGDWPLESQGPLCELLDVGRIAVTLTGDFLMVPAKSLSGVIGGRAG